MKNLLPALLKSLREPHRLPAFGGNRIQRRTVKSVGPLLFTSLFLAIVILLNIIVPTLAQTDRCADPNAVKSMNESELSACLGNLTRALGQSQVATAGVQKQIDGIRARVTFIENDLAIKQEQIDKSQEDLARIMDLLYATIRNYYMESQGSCPICDLLINPSISDFVKIQAYEKTRIDRDKAFIINTVHSIQTLEVRRLELEGERVELAAVKVKLDKVVTDSRAYQATLSSQIALLSAQQQQILSQRLAALNIPRSAGASALYCTDDTKIDPGFSPRIAFFTYGIPHYVGMNQYGAYGRAKANQDYKTILNAYFQNISIECRDIPSSIDVQGYEPMNFEDYIKGVVNKEMGADLPEALKAQAIAARSFAMNEAKPICTSQSCQVYSNDRRDAANSAVDATGQIACGTGKAEFVVSTNGSIAKTWYASTFGGYAHTSAEIWGGSTSYTKNFADTKAPISSFDDLKNNAYDNESTCFYTAQGWRGGEYKNSAWLRPEEVADIANVILLVHKDSSKKCFLYQPDKPPPPPDASKGCPTTDNWSPDKVRQELGGEAISTATSVEVTGVDWNSGKTTEVKVNGISFDGNEFKNYFNLRAPANIQIVGPLYNIERN
ncbi:MAG: SpoIID/LytB domain-containing protein [Candidatus Levyibacteriota bacterium]